LSSFDRQTDRRAPVKTRWSRWIAACVGFFGALSLATGTASAETRSLKLEFIHTGEKAEIVFKRNGRYDQAGLKKINNILRDWRRNEPTRMDPRLLDLVWEVYRAVGARDYIHVVSAYRSPATNSMLRKRSKGVAQKSQHMLGKAMDFFIPGVSLKKLRETGMKMQVGGVGYYPRSGSPFVHMDVGNVRHWPKMSRRELVSLFPNGKTLHVPSDGKPLPGYEQALASYQSRKKSGASALAMVGGSESSKPARKATNLMAALFGGGADEEEDVSESEAPAAKPAKAAPPKAVAEEAPAKAAEPLPGIEIIPPGKAKRANVELFAEPEAAPVVVETPATIIAALPAREVPLPGFAPRPKAEVAAAPAPIVTASIPPQDVPEQVPFGMADAAPAAAEAAPGQVPFGMAEDAPAAPVATAAAVDVPLPVGRPATAAVSDETEKALLMALAAPDPAEPQGDVFSDVIPVARPDAERDDFPVGALPDTAAEPVLGAKRSLSATDQAAVEVQRKVAGERVAALASPRLAIAAGADPKKVVGAGVKTTRKAARANPNDGKPGRKAVVVSAEPDAARWVLTKDYVANTTAGTKAPSFAYNMVVTAPREVYTAGFQKGGTSLEDINRFSGKAVTFMSVARFQ